MSSPSGALPRMLLLALAAGIEGNSTNTARTSLPSIDPLLWLLARRRLRRLLESARLQTGSDNPTHHMRVASLQLLGVELSLDDTEASTATRYEAQVRPLLVPNKPTYWTAALITAVVLVAVLGLIYRHLHRPFDPHRIAAAALLEESLSQWTLTAGTPKSLDVQETLKSAAAQKKLGSELSGRVLEMLTKGIDAAKAAPEARRAAVREFVDGQQSVNRALEQRGLPLFVDVTLLPKPTGHSPLVMTYYVERDVFFRYRDQSLRAIFGWRMDPMRVRLAALGYVREGNPVAVISYDLIEAMLVLHLLPSIVENEPAFVYDEATRLRGDPQVSAFESRLGAALRQRFHARGLSPDAQRLGQLLAQRRNLIAKWRRTITGFSITPPERLLPERDLGSRLEAFISRTEAAAWARLCDELVEPQFVAAFERERNAWANAVLRHELQHLIDQLDGLAGIPVVLARRLRVDPGTEPEPFSLFGAARAELSAYLAEVADGPEPRLSLVQLTAAVLDRSLHGTPHHFAVATLFDGLMKSLGVLGDHPSYDEALVRVVEADPEAARTAARSLYEEWFGRPLATAAHIRTVERDHWRH